ncbi:hypothetical protein [Streptomyces sp. NPDC001508]|uniref:hypothetical protein n=1 Tax=Streptomyces sp. NPDC001508 TaxID=3154656 RepID=UPI00331FBA9F
MNITLKRLLGTTAAVTTGAAALLGAGAGTAGAGGANGRAHCERAERVMWSSGPATDVIGHRCDLPDEKRRWYTIEIDTLVHTHHQMDYADGKVVRTETLHDRSVRCLGYTSRNGTVHWFGCPPS